MYKNFVKKQKHFMKNLMICKFFFDFLKSMQKKSRKTLQVGKTCNDVFIMYAKIMMVFYQICKKWSQKILKAEIALIFLPKFCVLRSAKFI